MTNEKKESSEKITIVRKAKKSKYSIISNSVMQDMNLSWKAKGILCYLLHLPDDWKINLIHLEKQATDGIESLKSGFKELKESGYIEHDTLREKGKIIGHLWIVHEEPINITEKPSHNECEPEAEKPATGFTTSGKSATTNTIDSLSKDKESIQNTNNIVEPVGSMSADADHLLSFFIEKLKERKPDIKLPDRKRWLQEIDRMIRIDKRDPRKIKAMIDWIHRDPFWSANILSPLKLRQQYDQIELQAIRKSQTNNTQKNKEYALRQKEKYPETYKHLAIKTRYAVNQTTGAELLLEISYDSFKRSFVKMFGVNWDDLNENDRK